MISELKEKLFAPETSFRFRTKKFPNAWTRTRCLTFERVVTLILRGIKFPFQNNLNRFFKQLGLMQDFSLPTSSAYSQARCKIHPELFKELNDWAVERFYELFQEDDLVTTFHGYRLVASDGSYINLPTNSDTLREFSVVPTNSKNIVRVQALACVFYDPLNDLPLKASLTRIRAEKKFLFQEVRHSLNEGDLVLLDRLYADYSVMAFFQKHKRFFLIRFSLTSFNAVKEFVKSGKKAEMVHLKVNNKQKRFVEKEKLPKEIQVRLIRVELENGEIEVLGTNCFEEEIKNEDWKWVYHKRWGEETYFDRLKNIFEIERFSGESTLSIRQDFFGTIFLSTIESLVTKEAEEELEEESREKELKYKQQVNHSVSYSGLMDYLVELLLDQTKDAESVFEELKKVFKTNPTRVRPGRRYERKKEDPRQKFRYQKYEKKIPT